MKHRMNYTEYFMLARLVENLVIKINLTDLRIYLDDKNRRISNFSTHWNTCVHLNPFSNLYIFIAVEQGLVRILTLLQKTLMGLKIPGVRESLEVAHLTVLMRNPTHQETSQNLALVPWTLTHRTVLPGRGPGEDQRRKTLQN